MDKLFMSLSIVPYLLFLYLIYRVYKTDPRLVHKVTLIGFASMIGFIIITAVVGIIAVRVLGARTLAGIDALHAVAELGLTVTNGLIALGLKKRIDELNLAELDRQIEAADNATASELADSLA